MPFSTLIQEPAVYNTSARRTIGRTASSLKSVKTSTMEITDRIEVMCRQEETIYSCSDYIKAHSTNPPKSNSAHSSIGSIDSLCRKKMAKWCFHVIDYAQFERNTVSIAMSYLDRFLSTSSPRALSCIHNRKEYQLASMTTLYMAIKLFEPMEMCTKTLASLSRDSYTPMDFKKMEEDILWAIQWRVNGPTALTFVQCFIDLWELNHGTDDDCESVHENTGKTTTKKAAWSQLWSMAKYHTELATSEYTLAMHKPSTIAIASISASLKHIPLTDLSTMDRANFLLMIASAMEIDLKLSPEIFEVKDCLTSIPYELEMRDCHCMESGEQEGGMDVVEQNPRKNHDARNVSPTCVSSRR